MLVESYGTAMEDSSGRVISIDWGRLLQDNPTKKGVLLLVCPKTLAASNHLIHSWSLSWDVRSAVLWNLQGVQAKKS